MKKQIVKKQAAKILTTALLTGLIVGATAFADEATSATSPDQGQVSGKNSCKGKKNGCKGMTPVKAKKKDKNACGGKNGCGEKEKKAE